MSRTGGGWLRILTFDPMSRDITVTTYSPVQDKYNCFAEEVDSFVLNDAF